MKSTRFRWRFVIYGAVGGFLTALPQLIGGNDLLALVAFLAASVITGIVMLITACLCFRGNRLAVVFMLIVFIAIGIGLFKKADDLHSIGRWLVVSKKYKAEVLRQSTPSDGTLKHVEWDGWGFAGADTTAYLVYDPNDLLAVQVREHSSGSFRGIACEVAQVQRFEAKWYSVTFYTDTSWGHCSYKD